MNNDCAGVGRNLHLGDSSFFHRAKDYCAVLVCGAPKEKDVTMRQLICRKCFERGTGLRLHSSDVQRGVTMRSCWIATVKPEVHSVAVNGVFEPLDELMCDSCGEVITGQIARAVTVTPPERTIGPWEHEFGKVLTEQEVAVIDKLKGETHVSK